MMAWCRTGSSQLHEQMVAPSTDTYMRHYELMSYKKMI